MTHEARSWWQELVDPKFLVSLILICLFGYAYFAETDRDVRNLLVGALIAGFSGAWGYWLGSSNSSNKVRDQMDRALGIAEASVPSPDNPQPVVIEQPAEKPVPVSDTPAPDDAGLPESIR